SCAKKVSPMRTTNPSHVFPQHYPDSTGPPGVGPENYTLDYNECYFNFCECCPPERGPRGLKGERGLTGIDSLICFNVINYWATGEKGLTGAAGLPGPPGISGDVGYKGEKGEVGLQGLKGEKGQKGEPGKNGTAGEKGEPGKEGPAGPPGVATVQGPKGDKGDRGECASYGEKGHKGEPGEPGAPGIPGAMGIPGQNGEPGVRGLEGPQGIRGIPGPRGERGYPGMRGERGFRGFKGAKGSGSGVPQKHSAFSVGISPRKSFPPSGFPIRFDKVFYNEENHFNITSNSFTCVYPGVYVFSFHITVRNQPLRATLVVNGSRRVRTRDSLYGQDIDQASTLVVLRLAAGDQVWMETLRDWNGAYASSEDDSIFSGFLLYSDKP
uniref:Otolin 1 n=1 Tax=Pundamilia nyererei TaxID=303518 RepID=A0A3B4FE07_9CICH